MSTVIITRTVKVTKTIRHYPKPEWEQLEFDFVVT